jgi:hypothetical protein
VTGFIVTGGRYAAPYLGIIMWAWAWCVRVCFRGVRVVGEALVLSEQSGYFFWP